MSAKDSHSRGPTGTHSSIIFWIITKERNYWAVSSSASYKFHQTLLNSYVRRDHQEWFHLCFSPLPRWSIFAFPPQAALSCFARSALAWTKPTASTSTANHREIFLQFCTSSSWFLLPWMNSKLAPSFIPFPRALLNILTRRGGSTDSSKTSCSRFFSKGKKKKSIIYSYPLYPSFEKAIYTKWPPLISDGSSAQVSSKNNSFHHQNKQVSFVLQQRTPVSVRHDLPHKSKIHHCPTHHFSVHLLGLFSISQLSGCML